MKSKKIAIIAALTLGVGISAISFTGCGAHEHAWGDWEVTTPASCTEAGEETRVCEKDGSHKETRPVTASGHNWGDWEVTTPASCTEAGEETRVCKTDKNHKETRPVNAAEHDWNEWTVEKKPSLTETGLASRTCKNATEATVENKEKEQKVLPKLNQTDYTFTNTASTCGAAGTSVYSYDKDGIKFSVTIEGDKLQHLWGNWIVTDENKPTASAGGKAVRVCTREDCDGSDELALPALTSEDYTITDNTAKCYEAGTGTYTYTKDGETVSFTAATPLLPHNLDEGTDIPASIDSDAKKVYACKNEGCDYKKEEVNEGTKLESQIYNITVKNLSGTPAKNITVKLGEYSAVTDENGVAAVRAFKDGYTVVIENRYEYDAGEVTADEKDITVTLPEARASEIGAGIYYATIRGVEDPEYPGHYQVRAPQSTLNAGNEAKLFTVTILSDNTSIIPSAIGLNMIEEKGASYQVVVEARQSTSFEVCTNDLEIEEGYLKYVVFSVKEEAAPAQGVKLRPAPSQIGENGKPAGIEGNEAYISLDYETFGSNVEITFGSGVTVTDLGLNVNNAGEIIESGEIIKLSDSYKHYLRLNFTDAESKVTLTKYYFEGEAQNPIIAKADGTENEVKFDLSIGIVSKWYKLTVDETAFYTLSTDNSTSYLAVYESIDGEPLRVSNMGGSLVNMHFEAGIPVYILATDSLKNDYNFICTKFSEDDMGNDPTAPIEITHSGNYKAFYDINENGLGDGLYKYYKLTAEQTSKVTISYTKHGDGASDKIELFVFDNAEYEYTSTNRFAASNILSTDLSSETVYVSAGDTLYFITAGLSKFAIDTTFNIQIQPLAAHSYEVTVALPEGAPEEASVEGVVVKLTANGETVATATVEDGKAVFDSVVPHYFQVELENLPAGYGYYGKDGIIALNADEKTEFTLTLIKCINVAYTVKLPDGTGAAGVKIKLKNSGATQPDPAEELEFITDENGVANISVIPAIYWKPASRGSLAAWVNTYYIVSIELPESLSEYVYNGTLGNFTSSTGDTELTLSATVNYKLTLKGEDGNALGGVTVKVVSGSTELKTAVTDENGVANVGLVAGEYTLDIEGYVTGTALTADNLDVEVKCYEIDEDSVVTGGTTSKPARVYEGTTTIYNSTAASRYFEFYPKDAEGYHAGTYKVTLTDITSDKVYLYQIKDGGTRGTNIYNAGVVTGYENKVSVAEGGCYEGTTNAKEFTLNMSSDDDFFLVLSGKGYFRIEITKISDAA